MNLNFTLQTTLLAMLLCGQLIAQIPFTCIVVDSASNSPAKPYGKAIGEINRDGQPDLFISSADNGGMHWYRYPDWKRFVLRDSGSWSEDCQLVDIDNDGDCDVVIRYEAGRDKSLIWKEHTVRPDITRMHGLSIADFNNDGHLDIHTSIRHDHPGEKDNVSIWLSNGATEPVFTEQVISTRGSHFSKTGDIDQDGDIDIFGANWSGPRDHNADILLWRNNSK